MHHNYVIMQVASGSKERFHIDFEDTLIFSVKNIAAPARCTFTGCYSVFENVFDRVYYLLEETTCYISMYSACI